MIASQQSPSTPRKLNPHTWPRRWRMSLRPTPAPLSTWNREINLWRSRWTAFANLLTILTPQWMNVAIYLKSSTLSRNARFLLKTALLWRCSTRQLQAAATSQTNKCVVLSPTARLQRQLEVATAGIQRPKSGRSFTDHTEITGSSCSSLWTLRFLLSKFPRSSPKK